jgi:hypothetical protein
VAALLSRIECKNGVAVRPDIAKGCSSGESHTHDRGQGALTTELLGHAASNWCRLGKVVNRSEADTGFSDELNFPATNVIFALQLYRDNYVSDRLD